jgi:hypothetical protein
MAKTITRRAAASTVFSFWLICLFLFMSDASGDRVGDKSIVAVHNGHRRIDLSIRDMNHYVFNT